MGMDQRDLARILVRIVGLIFISYAVIALPSNVLATIGLVKQKIGQPELWAISIAPFIYLVVGLGLFSWSRQLADRIVGPRGSPISSPTRLHVSEEIAAAIVGLYF